MSEKSKLPLLNFLFLMYVICVILFGLLKFDGTLDYVKDIHLVIKQSESVNINLIVGKTLFSQIARLNSSYAIVNLMGNIIMTVPLGILLEIRNAKFRNIIVIIVFSIMLEVAQLILSIGYFDIDDIILNTIGGIIGVFFMKLVKRIFKKVKELNNEKQTFKNC